VPTPVLLIAFARPANVESLIRTIRTSNPKRLIYLCVDKASESHSEIIKSLNNRVIQLANSLSMQPNLVKIVRESNLGTTDNICIALAEVLALEDKVIVLEDDCLPSIDFFEFCEWGLTHFENDKEIVSIQGVNHFRWPLSLFRQRYFRHSMVHVWGWATWSSKWFEISTALADLRAMSHWELSRLLRKNLHFRKYVKSWLSNLQYAGIISWDLVFQFWVWKNRFSVVAPGVNLVRNVGFDDVAVNSQTFPDHYQSRHNSGLRFPPSLSKLPKSLLTILELLSFRLFAASRMFRVAAYRLLSSSKAKKIKDA
jgi:hypothetical protein